MPRRHVNWNMGKMYGRGWQRGVTETEADYREWYHLGGITYPELCKLIVEKGRVTLRNNSYPMVMLVLSLVKKDEFYYILPIAEKFKWSRFNQWSKATAARFVWQGYLAQVLLKKLLQYMPEGDMRQKALKALKWVPKGGSDEVRAADDLENISAW